MNDFKLEGREYIELMKLLKFLGLVESGAEAKMVIDEGLVAVNGKTELRRRCKLRPGDVVSFDGQQIDIS
jgi:ribosome-associated protein